MNNVYSTDEARSTLLGAAERHYDATAWAVVREALSDPLFPVTYFIRNTTVLMAEPGWAQLEPLAQADTLLDLLWERSRIFLEVREWLTGHEEGRQVITSCRENLEKPYHPIGYCNHCGGCCEIASGMPDFPSDSVVPDRWRMIFGMGLGRGHRFCAFLWENGRVGGSLCSIHPWRSKPCRIFEQEECDFFKEDPNFGNLLNEHALMDACHRLVHLIDRG
ncbi:MAG: hypothetical protein ACLGPL_05355 [Acidobacteriota bacterium]